MKRREILIKALQAGALLSIPKPLQFFANEKMNAVLTETSGAGNPLRFPPVFTNGSSMTLAQSTVQVWPSQNTSVIAINGSYPGPTVIMEKGQTFTANFHNGFNEEATIHWHGMSVPEIMDGHPKDAIAPNGDYTYTFPVINRGGTFFYHSHAHHLTAKHVYKGFAGFFIVVDPAENFNLPSGNYDVPLCIQDHRITDIPDLTYSPGTPEMNYGYLGDTVLVNGTPDAYLEVGRTLYRFRLLNGSNARVYKIQFSDNRSFHIIATDGGLKDYPAQVNNFMLAPGERVEILVDFSTNTIGQDVTLQSASFSHPGPLPYKQGIPLDIIRFDVTSNNTSGGVVPAAFNPISYYDPTGVPERVFVLSMLGSHPAHRINGLTFDMERIDWEIPLNSFEVWKIVNQTADFHPMHSHGLQWQVISRNGNTNLPPSDKGWKDTVLVNAVETVKVMVRFTDYKGIFLFHCHNLEHEDDGMMLNFEVTDPIGIQQIGAEVPVDFELHQNYPNPFNPKTKIRFSVPKSESFNSSVSTEIEVFDLSGRSVRKLYSGILNPGKFEIDFDGTGLSSGTYICRMSAGSYSKSIKLMLVK